MDTPEQTEKELQVFLCTNCGAGMKYKPGTETMVCSHCNTQNNIPKEELLFVEELDFGSYMDKLESENLKPEKVVRCKNCGSTSSVAEDVKSLNCPYCSSPLVEADIYEERFIKPGYLLPFNIDDSKVISLLTVWINGLWFAPNNLKKAALSPIGLKGVYVPYWTYDANTESQYSGSRGDDYTVTVGSGDNKRTETRTSWSSVSGAVYLSFDDITIPASGNIDSKSLMQLEPWDTESLVSAKDEYLSGFITEKYKVKLKEGFGIAKIQIDSRIESAVCSDIGGDRQRISSVNTAYNDITFKHLLLPVYVSAYRYDGKVYNFYVNGRNGKLVGSRPYSVIKIIFAVLLAVVVIAMIYMFYQQGN